MALVRPLDVDCRWNYIYIDAATKCDIRILGFGTFSVEQFIALTEKYPEDFPPDIKERLIKELTSIIRYPPVT